MSSTNKTTNYELSQFLGSDKPAWLSDYNTDMSKIDAQMKVNADGVTAAAGSATSANTAIGTLANLTTEAKTNLVNAINEVDSHADTAQGTANDASTTAGSALLSATASATAVNNLTDYLDISANINNYNQTNMSITQGGGSIRSANITVARNSTGTLCKIYGYVVVDNPTGSASKVKLNANTGLKPDSKMKIYALGINENFPNSYGLSMSNLDINTDGTLEFNADIASGMTGVCMRYLACLIFVKNFGDVPSPE